jgi:hypothetical protein
MDEHLLAGFWDELEKIAISLPGGEVTDTEREVMNRIGAGAAGVGSALVASRGLGGLAHHVFTRDITSHPMATTESDALRLSEKIAPGASIVLGGEVEHAGRYPHGIYPEALEELRRKGAPKEFISQLSKNVIISPPNVGRHILAHELGHEAAARGLGRLQVPLRRLGPVVQQAVAPGVALAADPDSTAAKAAPLLALAGTAPILGEEAYASLKGYGALKRMSASPAELAIARRQLGKAFLTYAGHAAPWVAAPYVIRKVRQALRKRQEVPMAEQQVAAGAA